MRSFIADTLALVVFFTIVGALNERFVAGMGWDEVATARMIGAPLMVLTARPYGLWRDWFVARTAPPLPQFVADAVALLVFQVPIYAAIVAMGGASGAAILRGCLGFAVLMMLVGRPYGIWLDFIRARFGLGAGGMRPMSLQ
ncbi:L-alanine exporter AlaE [Acuticoccus sp. MNP-M23]|uniref:L-alanine exporter AlaE n=1 Tax=Acuticoccus sp. MNP-M23 TaxID=3072793 RepID=UPI0028168A65|nr:L-alanine exporter AlaE [Acuticoccus sp. MNP-M23]WMS43577.1 L-alanine exporter AlaE [Acuticoccus sp. MNP-M23]